MSASSCSSASGELWGFPLMPNQITVDVLLPTGIYISVKTCRECLLMELKGKVWKLAKDQPLFQLLAEQNSYIFVGITKDAKQEEFYDEQRRICDIHLFQPVIKLVEAEGNREEKILKHSLTQAIGIPVSEFDKAKDAEVEDFRRNMSDLCKKAVEKRNATYDSHTLLAYHHPPRLELSSNLPSHIVENLMGRYLVVVKVWFTQKNCFQTNTSVCVNCNSPPSKIISDVFKSRSFTKLHGQPFDHKRYILKVSGRSEYLEGEHPITQYRYIRQCIYHNEMPDLILENIVDVANTVSAKHTYMPPRISRFKPETKNRAALASSCVTKTFRVKVKSGSYLNVGDNLCVYIGLFHGLDPLCSHVKTDELDGSEVPKWNQWLEFDSAVADIPRGARLCLSVCGIRRKKDEHWPLHWVNIPVYDFNGYFVQGQRTVGLWNPPCHMEMLFNPLGVTGSNPCKEAPCLKLEFDSFGSVVQCSDPAIDSNVCGDYADLSSRFQRLDNNSNLSERAQVGEYDHSQEAVYNKLSVITCRDALYVLTDEEKTLIWECRNLCPNIPESLPKLLQATNWGKQECVQEVYFLLKSWKMLAPEISLELLDSKYPDPSVRQFATRCLEKGLTDDGVLMYLLQLVTALKFEMYLDSPLLRFLLEKALCNRRIGHFFFWHLKSEMHDMQVALKFGVCLEAYCRTCGVQLEELVRQTEIVNKLINVHTILSKEDVSQKVLRDHLLKPDYQELLNNNMNPLDPAVELGKLSTDLCEVKGSAKRPIILWWQSTDNFCERLPATNGILFKHGDDLRQDMLTLQILRIMDDIWQNDDLDMRVSPYMCMAMGQNVGMIEIVKDSETIMCVQRKGGVVGSLQLRSSTLHQWLKNENQGEKQYQQAIYNFTHSCAGYCVATLVLGIADRHNDNIMIGKSGRMFHIDFGHFLNHRKKKYGVCRNRVPFVLPDDFLRIICRGATSDIAKTDDYKNFEELCCRAYLSLRAHARTIINLLSMMIGAGIPELSGFDDVEYVRASFALDKTREEAAQYFIACMAAAQHKQWTTKMDWACHTVRHSVRK